MDPPDIQSHMFVEKKCVYQCGPDSLGNCLECGQPVAASGCDGGSWVHTSKAPDRVIMSTWQYGKLLEERLANGVRILYKHGGVTYQNRYHV
jgi:hypothetical protein